MDGDENARLRAENMALTWKLATLQAELDQERKAHARPLDLNLRTLVNGGHELRAPLNSIIGYTEMMTEELGEATPETLRRDLQNIQQAGRQALRLVNELFADYEREAGLMPLPAFDLDDLIQDVSHAMRPQIETMGKVFQADSEIPGRLSADYTQVRHLLIILLHEAAKYALSGTIELSVSQMVKGQRAWIVFRITHVGTRLEDSWRMKDLEALSHGDDRNISTLSLRLAWQCCAAIGGSLEVLNEPAPGLTFSITVPNSA